MAPNAWQALGAMPAERGFQGVRSSDSRENRSAQLSGAYEVAIPEAFRVLRMVAVALRFVLPVLWLSLV